MDQPEHLASDPVPAPNAPDRRRACRLAAVATGTTIALGAGGIAYAATTEPTPTPSNSAPGDTSPEDGTEVAPDDRADGDRPHGPHVGILGFGGMPLHGEQVVETEDGTYETVATQRGTIDDITDDSLTVTSEDGYTATYVLDDSALEPDDRGPVTDPADLAVGDEVMVLATVDGTTSTVERLIDLADLPVPPGPGGPGERWHGEGPLDDDAATPETST